MEDSRFVDSCRSSPKKLCRNNVPRIPGGSSDSDIVRYQSRVKYPRYERYRKLPREIGTNYDGGPAVRRESLRTLRYDKKN